tara:strand:- start:835 stop:1032 length:198 start_codon:yes stop_codon:yes gene_type:complete
MAERTEEQEKIYQELFSMLELDGWDKEQSNRWQYLIETYPIITKQDSLAIGLLNEGASLKPNFLD